VIALAALVALPTAAAAIWLVLRSGLAERVIAQPTDERWHERPTPMLGGVGIYAGLVAGVGAAVATGLVPLGAEVAAIVGGATILFVAGLVDDLRSLGPLLKIAAQLAAAALVLSTALTVEVVENRVLGVALGLVWIVGMTNAFNFLDNMDGLAATLAAIAALYFAIDAYAFNESAAGLAIAVSLCLACAGFLPFNIRPARPAAIFMGDSGSQVLGFTLACLGLLSSYKVAGTTVATLAVPILILAVPILDTALVTVVRLLEGRPVHQGGRDHTSHRLVYQGLSERRALVLLALVAASLGASSLAYNVVDNARIALLGILLTFAALVQFGSFLGDLDRTHVAPPERGPRALRTILVHRRRLLEVVVDSALVIASFLAAYLLVIGGEGTINQRSLFLATVPVLLFARYLFFIPFGLYRGVWRYAGARDAVSVMGAVVVSGLVAYGVVESMREFGDFPLTIFAVDGLLCTMLVGASRFGERALDSAFATFRSRGAQERTLIVGAGRSGRSLLRELRETPGRVVVGFVDDDPRLRRRRLQGVTVLGSIDELDVVLAAAGPDAVLVTIPDAPRERLDAVVLACANADVACRFVRRDIDLDPETILSATAP
jgi:UDP-GlcNAc:undecaprenyl-phosphate GlcNAc-1-phosphate transferase